MDTTTGQIKELKEITPEEMATGNWIELGKRPNPGCKRCHGRGYVGRDTVTNKVLVCKCVKARPVKQTN